MFFEPVGNQIPELKKKLDVAMRIKNSERNALGYKLVRKLNLGKKPKSCPAQTDRKDEVNSGHLSAI